MPTTVIIGAGPAGLTAAFELTTGSDQRVIVLEAGPDVGGISRSVRWRGNILDIGGHRFFSQAPEVLTWWCRFLPLDPQADAAVRSIAYRGRSQLLPERQTQADAGDDVMLLRRRSSPILHRGRLFNFPLRLDLRTLSQLGPAHAFACLASYAAARVAPIRPEATLEHFFINRFGRRLYRTFFRDYTRKVWGVPCRAISAQWGAQRIRGLSARRWLRDAIWSRHGRARELDRIGCGEWFLYPKHGPGHLWEVVARRVRERGGEVRTRAHVVALHREGDRIATVVVEYDDGRRESIAVDHVVSTMAIADLVAALAPAAPPDVADIARALPYREFISVGVLLRDSAPPRAATRDHTWIYVQEPSVQVGRVQVLNNWSEHLAADPRSRWLALEYFCARGDALWSRSNVQLRELALDELEAIGLGRRRDVIDVVVVRQPKAYPAYTGAYARFGRVREWLDGIANLFLVGRNGMHRYNNQDHSMLTAMAAANQILDARRDPAEIWSIHCGEESAPVPADNTRVEASA